ncbi:MAG: hypothetical protein QME57_04750 [Patescibacteria group bacterium]|nr:hypothetical protein [Patescibacteria group bacterium]
MIPDKPKKKVEIALLFEKFGLETLTQLSDPEFQQRLKESLRKKEHPSIL